MGGRLSAVVGAALAVALGAVALQSSPALKLRVAVQLFGYDGLLNIARASIAERLVGERPTLARRAFHEMLDSLAEAERSYLGPQRGVTSDEDIAEGLRYMTHLLRTGFELHFESDVERPQLLNYLVPHRKLLGDCPDAIYLVANLDPSGGRTYVLHGKLQPDEVYTSVSLAEAPCQGCFANKVFRDVNVFSLRNVGADGSWTLYIGGKENARPAAVPADADWIPGPDGAPAVQVLLRHYFERVRIAQVDPEVAPSVTIAIVGAEEPSSQRVRDSQPAERFPGNDAEVARRFGLVSAFVRGHSMGMNNDPATAPSWFSFERNVFGVPKSFRDEGADNADTGGGLGAVDIVYSAAPFRLEPGQGLLIEGSLPACKYANVVLWNRYLQSFEYELGHPISLNKKQMRHLSAPDAKGFRHFKLLLAPQPPPESMKADWLDSMNRTSGTAFWRFILPEQDVPAIRASLVDL